MLFAKNSDREPNEAQALERIPAQNHSTTKLALTYIEIPQVKKTNELILSRPFQMWGAEMGANEHGLVIGNEAVFTRIKFPRRNQGMTGMDMLRLALERTANAASALEYLCHLIENYSQDACGGYTDKKFYYHSSFIIADPGEAYVLESAGHHWAAIRVQGFRSISNGLTIENEYDYASPNLVDFAHQKGWIKNKAQFSFREAYSESFLTYFSKCKMRQLNSMRAGEHNSSGLEIQDLMAILRTHKSPVKNKLQNPGSDTDPAKCDMSCLCMHATGLTTPSQTTASMVAELRPHQNSTFWFTGTAAPCLSLFKPFYIPGNNILADNFQIPGARPDSSLWWQSEKLHRRALKDYGLLTAILKPKYDPLEASFIEQESRLASTTATTAQRHSFSQKCLQQSSEALQESIQASDNLKIKYKGWHPMYRLYRRKLDKQCQIKY